MSTILCLEICPMLFARDNLVLGCCRARRWKLELGVGPDALAYGEVGPNEVCNNGLKK